MSRRTGEDEGCPRRGAAARSPAFTADLRAVHSGTRQLVVARCHAKLWPLPVQSHHRAGQGQKDGDRRGSDLRRHFHFANIPKVRKKQVSMSSGAPAFGSF